MPTPLPDISDLGGGWADYAQKGVNMANVMQQMAQQRRQNALDDQQRELSRNVGNALADPNQGPDVAANLAYQGGALDAGRDIKKFSWDEADRALNQDALNNTKISNLLDSIASEQDPDKQAQKFGIAMQFYAKKKPQDAAKMMQESQQYGVPQTVEFYRNMAGKHADDVKAKQDQLNTWKGQVAGAYAAANGDDDEAARVLALHDKLGNPIAKQFLDPMTGKLVPGAGPAILSMGLTAKDIYGAEQKHEDEETKAKSKLQAKGAIGEAANKIAVFENDPKYKDWTIDPSEKAKLYTSDGRNMTLAPNPDGSKTLIASPMSVRERNDFDAANRIISENKTFNTSKTNPDDPDRPTDYQTVLANVKAMSKNRANSTANLAQAKLESFKSEYPDYTIPSAAFQEVSSNKDLMFAPASDGSKTAIAVIVDGRTKTAADIALRQQEKNESLNLKDGGNRETDLLNLYRSARTTAPAEQNASTREKSVNFQTNPNQPGSAAFARTEEGARQISQGRTEGRKDVELLASRAALVGGAINHSNNLIEELKKPEADQTLGLMHSSSLYQKIRGQFWPKETKIPSNWGKIGQNIASLQAEAERVYTQGQGAVTDTERARLKDLAMRIPEATNRQVALELAMNLRDLMAGLLIVPTTSDILKSPALTEARKQGLQNVEKLITQKSNQLGVPSPSGSNALAPEKPAPGRYKFNPATGDFQ
jgi:hypothetical protein